MVDKYKIHSEHMLVIFISTVGGTCLGGWGAGLGGMIGGGVGGALGGVLGAIYLERLIQRRIRAAVDSRPYGT